MVLAAGRRGVVTSIRPKMNRFVGNQMRILRNIRFFRKSRNYSRVNMHDPPRQITNTSGRHLKLKMIRCFSTGGQEITSIQTHESEIEDWRFRDNVYQKGDKRRAT
jgi:hypothetical protein